MTTLTPRSFHAHSPVGERVSFALVHDDGRPRSFWIRPNIPAFKREMDALYANELDPELTETEYDDFRAQLTQLRQQAMQGTVRLEGFQPDGKVIPRTKFVIELRPILQRGSAFGRKLRELRLYLAEPQLVQHGLLGLHLATKEASDDGYDEQDVSIDEAVDRAYGWEP
jgi:virulence-associated protein VapD